MVANEVKELAKRTRRATDEIGKSIETIRDDSKNAVDAIAKIVGIINEVNDNSNNIAAAVEEQTVTTNEISRNVTDAATGTGDIAHNISGVATAAEDTTRGAADTQAAARALSIMSWSCKFAVNQKPGCQSHRELRRAAFGQILARANSPPGQSLPAPPRSASNWAAFRPGTRPRRPCQTRAPTRPSA